MQSKRFQPGGARMPGNLGRRLGGALIAGAFLFGPSLATSQAQPAPRCPSNYSFTGSTCERVLTKRPTCPSGWRFSRGQCERSGGGASGGGCRYSGERGYNNPSGSSCLRSYTFSAWEDSNTDVLFRSDGRLWRFGETRSGWDLLSVSPPTKFGTTGNMRPNGNGFSGTFSSGFCGKGWIELTRIRGSC